jgi:hypothetical protein
MIWPILKNISFELGIRRKQISTYVYFVIFFSLALLMTMAAGGAFKGVTVSFGLSNKILINSPLSLNLYTGLLSAFGLFIIAPVFGQAVFKDFGADFEQIIYSTSVSRKPFLCGRFIGAVLTMLFIFTAIGFGIWCGSLLPSIQKNLLGKQQLIAYILPYFTTVLPNVFIFGSIFFLLASKTKNMASVYIAGIVIFMGWMLSGQLMADVDNKMILSLVDPFGLNATSKITEYWSITDQNYRFITLSGYLLYNRILWGTIGLICLLFSIFTFNIQKSVSKKKIKEKNKSIVKKKEEGKLTFIMPVLDRSSFFNMFIKQFSFEFMQIFKSIYFRSIALAGVLYVIIVSFQLGKMFGTTTYPVTYKVLDLLGGTFDLFVLIILILYAGDAVWRERDNKINQIIDATPVPTWVLSIAKALSLVCVISFLFLLLGICGVIIQFFKGYTHFELDLYVTYLFGLKMLSSLCIIMLAMSLQVFINNKYAAHALMILYYIAYAWLPSLGFEHKIYMYNSSSIPLYSDMNGFGRFIDKYLVFKAYWLSLGSILFICSMLMWQRGVVDTFKGRLNEAKRRFKVNVHGVLLLVLVVSFTGLGSFVFYNTNIINEYITSKENESLKHLYEIKYKSFEGNDELSVTDVKANVELYPYKRKMHTILNYTLMNNGIEDIKSIFFNVDYSTDFNYTLSVPIISTNKDVKLNVEIVKLKEAIKPGESIEMIFEVSIDNNNFTNSNADTQLVNNGTFFNNFHYFPSIGYAESRELSEEKTRVKYDLKKKHRMPKINDKKAQMKRYFGGSLITFEAKVSTAGDQIAIAPGYLVKEWKQDGRNHYHYKMDHKILNFFAFLSARYKVIKDKWHDVNIEIYYHNNHTFNLDRMIEGTKMSLDYFTKNFGPYQHKQYRILEFPRYESFAQAFPNTIPFSEAIGFIAEVDDDKPDDVDFPFYVTAHELGHQWWAHQLIGAGVQGATMMSETFSQYSALMVMKKRYGQDKMKKFLKYELDRYLRGRASENDKELPLYLNESQSYLHYRKGSLVMYALQDYVGEDVVNKTLKEYLNGFAKSGPPYTISTDFLNILYKNTKRDDHIIIDDLFTKIVLFHNRVLTSSYRKLENGKYEVDIKVKGLKFYADEYGQEKEKKFKQDIYIGVLDKDDKYLYLKKHNIIDGDQSIKVVVNDMPIKAGIDPLNILIDKNVDDNLMPVTELK